MTAFLRPLTEWPAPVPGQLLGILTDIDDAITQAGVAVSHEQAGFDLIHLEHGATSC